LDDDGIENDIVIATERNITAFIYNGVNWTKNWTYENISVTTWYDIGKIDADKDGKQNDIVLVGMRIGLHLINSTGAHIRNFTQ